MPDACPTCGKGPRSVLYCRKYPCGFRHGIVLAVDLPRPEVQVTTTSDGKEHVVISRDGRGKSYEISGATSAEKVRDAITKVISDKYTGEWLP